MNYGIRSIDDTLTFTCNTHAADTGAATDADAVPAYRVYEDETGTAILSGNMAKLDDGNTTGFYSEQITLSAANGFEVGKSYSVYISAAVDSVTGTMSHTFQVENIKANIAAILADTGTDGVLLAADAITAAKIADDAISSEHINTGAISADSIATGAITNAKFAAGAIDAAAIATDAFDADALKTDAITEIVAAVLAGVVEGSYTVNNALKAVLALFGGETSGFVSNAGTGALRDISDTKVRANVTIDANGNRTAVANIDLS